MRAESGVVDQQVDSAESRFDLVARAFERGAVFQIRHDRFDPILMRAMRPAIVLSAGALRATSPRS